jgi:hypothetical protein
MTIRSKRAWPSNNEGRPGLRRGSCGNLDANRDLEAQAPGAQVKRGFGERLGCRAETIDGWRLNVGRGQGDQCDENRGGSGTVRMLPAVIGRGRDCSRGRDCTAGCTAGFQSVCLSRSSLLRCAGTVRSIRTAFLRRRLFRACKRGHSRREQTQQQNRQGNDVTPHSLKTLRSDGNR